MAILMPGCCMNPTETALFHFCSMDVFQLVIIKGFWGGRDFLKEIKIAKWEDGKETSRVVKPKEHFQLPFNVIWARKSKSLIRG